MFSGVKVSVEKLPNCLLNVLDSHHFIIICIIKCMAIDFIGKSVFFWTYETVSKWSLILKQQN